MQRPLDDASAPLATLRSNSVFKFAAICVLSFTIAVAAWYVGQVVVLNHAAAAAVSSNVANAATPLQPGQALRFTVHGAGVALDRVELFRTDLDTPASELGVPSRLETAGDEGSWQVLSAIDGATLLRPDGSYRLVVRLTAPQPALPLPRTDVAEQQIRFTTAPSPVAIVPADVLEPNWADPVGFAWSMPMESMTATAAPDVPIAAWIDA